jgi:GntR family transcriptional regulator
MLRSDGIPLHHQLKEIFLEKISSGEWAESAYIPTEDQLCAEYGVSRGPVRQAIERLVRDGLLARRQGKGTWVCTRKIEGSLAGMYGFASLLSEKGLNPSSRLLSFDVEPASGHVARLLDLARGEKVHRIVRLRLAAEKPLALDRIFLPYALFSSLTHAQVSAPSLYVVLAEEFGWPLVRARQDFEAVSADDWEASLLQIEPGAPVLSIGNVTYAQGDVPILCSNALVRGDRMRYYVDLVAPTEKGLPFGIYAVEESNE